MQQPTLRRIEEPEDFQHFIQAMSQASTGCLHLTAHVDEYTACTLAQLFENLAVAIYNSNPERFPQGPPPPANGCECGRHDIENAILKGDMPDDPGNAHPTNK